MCLFFILFSRIIINIIILKQLVASGDVISENSLGDYSPIVKCTIWLQLVPQWSSFEKINEAYNMNWHSLRISILVQYQSACYRSHSSQLSVNRTGSSLTSVCNVTCDQTFLARSASSLFDHNIINRLFWTSLFGQDGLIFLGNCPPTCTPPLNQHFALCKC